MNRVMRVLAVLTLGTLVAGGLVGQEPKKAPAPTAKGTLPRNWSKIGLTDEQKQKVYTIRGDYKGKMDELRKEIVKLQKKEKEDLEKVLTDAQKTRLRELAAETAPAETKPKDDKKPQASPKPPEKKEP